jgi:hypothetical protein
VGSAGKFDLIITGVNGSTKYEDETAISTAGDTRTYALEPGNDVGVFVSVKIDHQSHDGWCIDQASLEYDGEMLTLLNSERWLDGDCTDAAIRGVPCENFLTLFGSRRGDPPSPRGDWGLRAGV